jgi:hypothetical protein
MLATVGGVAAVVLKVFKVIAQIVIFILKAILKFLIFFIGNLIVLFNFYVKIIVANVFGSDIGPQRFKYSIFDEFIFLLQVGVDEIMATLSQAVVPIIVFLIIISISLVAIGVAFGILFLISLIYPILFQLLDEILIVFQFAVSVLAPVLNIAMGFLQNMSPSWDSFLALGETLISRVVVLICNSVTEEAGSPNFLSRCPFLYNTFTDVLREFDVIVKTLDQIIISAGSIYTTTKDANCFNGVCPPSASMLFAFTPEGSFDPALLISILTDIINFLITYIFPIIRAIIYFVLDIMIFFLKLVVSIVAEIITNASPSQFSNFILNEIQSGTTLESTLPLTFLTQVLMGIEQVLTGVIEGIVVAIETIIILLDSAICNLILGFQTCLFSKICNVLFPPICHFNTVCIKYEIIVISGIEFNNCVSSIQVKICDANICNTLGLGLGNCVCDICLYDSPFNFIFGIFNLLSQGTTGELPVPCNGDFVGCTGCNSIYSIMRYVIPLVNFLIIIF